MNGVDKIINKYLEEITLVSNSDVEEEGLGDTRREVANTIINRAILSGKTNKLICSKRCKDEKCRRDCDLRATSMVITNLQTGVAACRGDQGCIKIVMSRMVNIAERGDSKVKMYGFGTPYLRAAIIFANRMGLQAR
jgi:hypothetical protein